MARLRGEELSKLYPTPKSYETLQAERNSRMQARLPKFFSIKISISSAIMLLVVLVSYQLMSRVIKDNFSSSNDVILGIFLSAIIIVFSLAIMSYFFLVIQELAVQVFGSTSEVFTTLIITWFFSAIVVMLVGNLHLGNPVSTVIVFALNVVVSFVAIELRKRRAKL